MSVPPSARDQGGAGSAPVSTEAIRAQLERILASPGFAKSERLSRFLRYVVEQTLRGRSDNLKEYVLGVEVFDRDPSFDPRTDALVRVQARRLRSKLREYYAAGGRDDLIRVELPTGGYVPVFLCGQQVASSPAPARRLFRWAALGLSAVVLAAVAAWSLLGRPWVSRPLSAIAVLPFQTLDGNPDSAYLTDGLVDDLTTALARVPGLRVVARTSAFQFRGWSGDLHRIGRQLRVGSVLEGSLRRMGEGWRVTVQLAAVADGYHLWSEVYDRRPEAMPALPDEIAIGAARTLGQSPAPRAGDRESTDPEAYQAYLRGRYFGGQRTPQSLARAADAYQQAIARDPSHAPSHAGLADACGELVLLQAVPPEMLQKAKASALKALELDATLEEAHAALAWITWCHDHSWAVAEKEFRRALQLNPSRARTHQYYGLGLMSRRRFEEALSEARMALDLDPLSYAVSNGLGTVLCAAGRYPEAVRQARRVLQLDPAFAPAHVLIGICHDARNRPKEAVTEFQKGAGAAPARDELLARLGHAWALAGRTEEARRAAAELDQAAGRGESSYVLPAFVYAGLSQTDQALAALEAAWARRDPTLVFLDVEPALARLRPDPRFRELRKKVGLSD